MSPKSGGGDDDEDKSKGEGLESDTALKGTLLAGVLLVGVVGGFGTVGYIYKDQINAFLNQFSGFIEGKVHLFNTLLWLLLIGIKVWFLFWYVDFFGFNFVNFVSFFDLVWVFKL